VDGHTARVNGKWRCHGNARVTCKKKDMTRCMQIVAGLVMAVLIANAHCYALCLASVCQTTAAAHTGGCHHSGNASCHYRQSNATGTEATPDLDKIPVAPLPAIAVALPACPLLVGFGQESPRLLERGSPPGKTSVLRI
jgi:hypothetical protein